MTAKQVQIRRDTAANLAAATPAAGELGWDTTNEQLVVGNGSAAGGKKVAMAKNVQNQSFTYGTVGGTADVITLTCSPVVASYSNGLRLSFRATSTNTGAVTVNVDGLGAKNVYKMSSGTLTALSAGDIASGGIYDIVYDGTQFQLRTGGGGLGVISTQTFTANGTYTPSTGMLYCIAEGVGGGGGGEASASSNGGSGGGAGGYVMSVLTSTDIGASKTVTIGTGGTGGISGSTAASAGGQTSLGSLLVAEGGGAGVRSSAATKQGGTGGAGTTGQIIVRGNDAQSVITGATNAGNGANSQLGSGGLRGATNGNAGSKGGGGGGGLNGNGGAGGDGFIFITEFCSVA